jgi:hypothetical protein
MRGTTLRWGTAFLPLLVRRLHLEGGLSLSQATEAWLSTLPNLQRLLGTNCLLKPSSSTTTDMPCVVRRNARGSVANTLPPRTTEDFDAGLLRCG